jgi:hypothetical protein
MYISINMNHPLPCDSPSNSLTIEHLTLFNQSLAIKSPSIATNIPTEFLSLHLSVPFMDAL